VSVVVEAMGGVSVLHHGVPFPVKTKRLVTGSKDGPFVGRCGSGLLLLLLLLIHPPELRREKGAAALGNGQQRNG
jgi:hypothetical protein